MQKNSQICDEIRHVCHSIFKLKAKFAPEQAMKIQRGRRGIAVPFNLGGSWGWVVNATPQLLYSRERNPVHIVREDRWALGLVWMGAEYIAPPTGIRYPNPPACTESLYRLSYAGPSYTVDVDCRTGSLHLGPYIRALCVPHWNSFLPSSPEALRTYRRERPLLAREGN
jgi:hypothetical protein